MPRGGPRKGSGRKPAGKVAILARVAPEVRARLERDAKRGHRTLSDEVVLRLTEAFSKVPSADEPTRALGYLITAIAQFAKGLETTSKDAPQFDWRNNRFDFEVFKHAVMLVLDRLAPPGEPGASRYREQTPEEAARPLVTAILGLLTMESDVLTEHGDRHGKARGSLYYAFPQAARALGFSTGGKK